MKNLIVFMILALAAVGFAQTKEKKVKMNEQFTLGAGRQATIKSDKLKVEFLSVTEDSRCPTDTNCIWAGNAKIKIKISKGKSAAKTFELNTNLEPQIITFAGYEIKLTNLTPSPATNIRINRNGYAATFLVSKAGK